jgi:hypothetical protein
MGGPSREAYLADKARQEARRAALRTRDGVVALDEWRDALEAKQCLEKLLGCPDWLLGIRVTPSPTVGVQLVVTFLWDSAQGHMCVPSAVDDVEVRVELRNAGARARPRRPR